MKAWIKDGRLEKETTTSTAKTPGPSGTNSSSSAAKSPSSASARVTWASDIRPIFSKSCGLSSGACHRANTVNSDLTTLESSKPNGQAIKTRVNSGNMPSGGTLSTTEKQKIVTWVDQGMN
jgi:exo-beta-1,3-glucanase (GH17 family)